MGSTSVRPLARLRVGPHQLLNRPQYTFPNPLPVYIAQLKQPIAALRSHQQGILGAVLLNEEVGGAVEVELRSHAAISRSICATLLDAVCEAAMHPCEA